MLSTQNNFTNDAFSTKDRLPTKSYLIANQLLNNSLNL